MYQDDLRLSFSRGTLIGHDEPWGKDEMVVRMSAATDLGGCTRNDDFYAFDQELRFACVADGVNGAPFGGAAARVACNRALEKRRVGLGLGELFADVNASVNELSRYLGGACSTFLMMNVGARNIQLVWVGDSVCYRLREGVLDLLTLRGRALSQSNALESGLGYGRSGCHATTADICAGDRIVLCTDGVWENVSGARMTKLLGEGTNAAGIASRLVREATSNGYDNATCVVVLFGNTPDVEDVS